MATAERTVVCLVSGQSIPLDEAVPVDLVRPSLLPSLKKRIKTWDPHGYVGKEMLDRVREEHIEELLKEDQGAMSKLHRDVAKSLLASENVAQLTDDEFDKNATFGQRVSDKIAAFGGSWTFIGIFGAILFGWMALNSPVVLGKGAFDPFPFIFLNLILSCIAAIQAPVIMMSQNRQETRDRLRGENDYKVNLKAELEIRHLHEKIDRLLDDQWKHLLEIQQTQMDMMREMKPSARE